MCLPLIRTTTNSIKKAFKRHKHHYFGKYASQTLQTPKMVLPKDTILLPKQMLPPTYIGPNAKKRLQLIRTTINSTQKRVYYGKRAHSPVPCTLCPTEWASVKHLQLPGAGTVCMARWTRFAACMSLNTNFVCLWTLFVCRWTLFVCPGAWFVGQNVKTCAYWLIKKLLLVCWKRKRTWSGGCGASGRSGWNRSGPRLERNQLQMEWIFLSGKRVSELILIQIWRFLPFTTTSRIYLAIMPSRELDAWDHKMVQSNDKFCTSLENAKNVQQNAKTSCENASNTRKYFPDTQLINAKGISTPKWL